MVGGVIAAFVGPNLANFGRGMIDQIPFAGGFVYVTGLYVLIFVVLFFIKLPPPTITDSETYRTPIKTDSLAAHVYCGGYLRHVRLRRNDLCYDCNSASDASPPTPV